MFPSTPGKPLAYRHDNHSSQWTIHSTPFPSIEGTPLSSAHASWPSQTAQFTLPGIIACDPISLQSWISLIQFLQWFRFHCESHGDHPLCYVMCTEHPSSKWLLRQCTGSRNPQPKLSPQEPKMPGIAPMQGLVRICKSLSLIWPRLPCHPLLYHFDSLRSSCFLSQICDK